MRKVLKILIWIVISAWFVVVMGFVNSENEEILCNEVDIVLNDSISNRFITVSDIRVFIEDMDMGLQGYPVKDINIRQLEKNFENKSYIKKAEVFNDITGKLTIKIDQREPLIRIMPRNGAGFYIAHDGYFLPLSENYAALIMLASGYINCPDEIDKWDAIHAFDSQGKEKYNHLIELYEFGRYIAGHPLWSNQIVQIFVNMKGEVELIPRVGAHQILLGSLDNYRIKLRNLEVLYQQGLSTYGWNSYDKINLKYLNQVICTKR